MVLATFEEAFAGVKEARVDGVEDEEEEEEGSCCDEGEAVFEALAEAEKHLDRIKDELVCADEEDEVDASERLRRRPATPLRLVEAILIRATQRVQVMSTSRCERSVSESGPSRGPMRCLRVR